MHNKKNFVVVFLLVLLVGLFVYPRIQLGSTVEAVGVSELSANLDAHLGPVTVTGFAGAIDAENGVFFLFDAGGCCSIPVVVPFNAKQQELSEMDTLYTGSLPQNGDAVTTTGTLLFEDGFYVFDVESVTRDGQVIISKK